MSFYNGMLALSMSGYHDLELHPKLLELKHHVFLISLDSYLQNINSKEVVTVDITLNNCNFKVAGMSTSPNVWGVGLALTESGLYIFGGYTTYSDMKKLHSTIIRVSLENGTEESLSYSGMYENAAGIVSVQDDKYIYLTTVESPKWLEIRNRFGSFIRII